MSPFTLFLLIEVGWLLIVGKAVQHLAERGPTCLARAVIGGIALFCIGYTLPFALQPLEQVEANARLTVYVLSWTLVGVPSRIGACLWVALAAARGRRGRWDVAVDLSLLALVATPEVMSAALLPGAWQLAALAPIFCILFAYGASQFLVRRGVRPDWEWLAFGWWGVFMFLTAAPLVAAASLGGVGDWMFGFALTGGLSLPALLFLHSVRELWAYRRARGALASSDSAHSAQPAPAP